MTSIRSRVRVLSARRSGSNHRGTIISYERPGTKFERNKFRLHLECKVILCFIFIQNLSKIKLLATKLTGKIYSSRISAISQQCRGGAKAGWTRNRKRYRDQPPFLPRIESQVPALHEKKEERPAEEVGQRQRPHCGDLRRPRPRGRQRLHGLLRRRRAEGHRVGLNCHQRDTGTKFNRKTISPTSELMTLDVKWHVTSCDIVGRTNQS